MNVELRLTIEGPAKVEDIHELLCLAIHEQDTSSLEALRSIVTNVGEVHCVDPGCTPFDCLTGDQQSDVIDYIDLGNDREDLKRSYAETFTKTDLEQVLGEVASESEDQE